MLSCNYKCIPILKTETKILICVNFKSIQIRDVIFVQLDLFYITSTFSIVDLFRLARYKREGYYMVAIPSSI